MKALVILFLTLTAYTNLTDAQGIISVNFASHSLVDRTYEVTTLAGVERVGHWNNFIVTPGSASNLIDETGAATHVDLAWYAGWFHGAYDDPGPLSGDDALMQSWLDDWHSPIATISDIQFQTYDLILYGSSSGATVGQNAGKHLGWLVNGEAYESLGVFVDPLSNQGNYWFGQHRDGETEVNNPSYLRIRGLSSATVTIERLNTRETTRSIIAGFQIVSTSPDDYSTWQRDWFGGSLDDPTQEDTLWGENADPDGDGLKNLLEFVMDLNPLVDDSGLGPLLKGGAFTYRQTAKTNHDVVFYVSWSRDSEHWTSGGIVYSVASEGDPMEIEATLVTYHEGSVFMRLEAMRTGAGTP